MISAILCLAVLFLVSAHASTRRRCTRLEERQTAMASVLVDLHHEQAGTDLERQLEQMEHDAAIARLVAEYEVTVVQAPDGRICAMRGLGEC